MKRSELEVGKEYWYSRSNSRWEDFLYEGTKVVVVDTDCWEEPNLAWSRETPRPRKVSKGSGVLVDITGKKTFTSDEEVVRRKVVNVSAIRGPYEETRQKIQAREDARSEKNKADQRVRQANDAKVEKAQRLAAERGIKVYQANTGSANVTLSADDLSLLLNLLNTKDES